MKQNSILFILIIYAFFISSCSKNDDNDDTSEALTFSISTLPLDPIYFTTGGTISGNAKVTQRGVVWSSASIPDTYILNSRNYNNTDDGSGNGTYKSVPMVHPDQLNTSPRRLYIRAYAILESGETFYGNEIRTPSMNDIKFLNSDLNYGLVSDIDGNQYYTIKIGPQNWMAENLKTTTFNDGNPIEYMGGQTWYGVSKPVYAFGEDFPSNGYGPQDENLNGIVYNGYAVKTGKLCPDGWRVPTRQDWINLIEYLGENDLSSSPTINLYSGNKDFLTLSLWPYNLERTNVSGFSVLPVGYHVIGDRYVIGSLRNRGSVASFWSSTDGGINIDTLFRILFWGDKSIPITATVDTGIFMQIKPSNHGSHCRCIQE